MSAIRVEIAGASHLPNWSNLRAALWPSSSVAEHVRELAERLSETSPDFVAFIATTTDGEAIGFVEAALRRDYVNGCETSPVAFLEGLHVAPEWRRVSVARMLVAAFEDWASRAGCAEMASDALLDNTQSHAFHIAAGFEETERVVFYRKATPRPG